MRRRVVGGHDRPPPPQRPPQLPPAGQGVLSLSPPRPKVLFFAPNKLSTIFNFLSSESFFSPEEVA